MKRDPATEEEIEAAVLFIVPELRRFAPTEKPEYAEDVREVIRRVLDRLGIEPQESKS